MIILPKIIIKKILDYLLVDFDNFKNYLLISKDYEKYLIERINKIQLIEQNQIDIIKNHKYLKNNIKSIVILNNHLLKYDNIKIFKNLKNIKIELINKKKKNIFTKAYNLDFLNNYNHSHLFNLKYKSFWFYFKFDQSNAIYSKLKKIEFPTSSVTFEDLSNLLENSYHTLTSIDVGIRISFVYLDSYTMFELDLNENEEKTQVLNDISRFDKLLKKCENLKKLSLRNNQIYKKNEIWKGHLNCLRDNAFSLIQNSIYSSILQFSKLSKLHFYGIFINRDFFNSLSQVKTLKSLKLVTVNFNLSGCEEFCGNEIYDQFIQYLYGNKNLVKLSVRANGLGLSDYQNDQFLKYLLQTTQLSYLNIAYNDFNLLQLFKQINENQKYQFSKISLSDNQLLPFDYLLSSDIVNLTNIKYYHGNQKIPIILQKDNILNFKNHFYDIPSDFKDISF